MTSNDRKSSQIIVVPGPAAPRPPYLYSDSGGAGSASERPIADGPVTQIDAVPASPAAADETTWEHPARNAARDGQLLAFLESDVVWLLMVSLVIAAAASLST